MTLTRPDAAVAAAPSSGAIQGDEATKVITAFYATVDDPARGAAELDAFFSGDFVDHDRAPNAPVEAPDRAVVLGLFAEIETGFSDTSHSLDILESLGEDRALVYWTFTATHTGTFFGHTATGNRVEIRGVDIFRVRDGKFSEIWHVEDLMALFAQITPATAAS